MKKKPSCVLSILSVKVLKLISPCKFTVHIFDSTQFQNFTLLMILPYVKFLGLEHLYHTCGHEEEAATYC